MFTKVFYGESITDTATGKIVTYSLVTKEEASSSSNMEPEEESC